MNLQSELRANIVIQGLQDTSLCLAIASVCHIEISPNKQYSLVVLTKTDLNQIRGVVREEVKNEVQTQLKNELEPVKKDLKVLKKDIKYLKKTANLIVKNYDEGGVLLSKRVTRIVEHLQI